MRPANRLRGEASLEIKGTAHVLRPSFENLVAAEEELGPLFALVERASEGAMTAREIAVLLWHCLADENRPSREEVGEALLEMGLVAATGPVRTILGQILQGRG